MMAANEARTLAALKQHRETVFDPAVAVHGGRIVKLVGDGTLVEFSSVVDAVNCALAVQQTLSAENSSAETHIALRIGINLGDIIVDGDDIYGDGVNVAARLEQLADPGGICIASTVNDSLVGKIDVDFIDGGNVTAKNIDRPIHIWKWQSGSATDYSKIKLVPGTALVPPRLLPIADKPSLAVLPFANLSGNDEQKYFADGITEDIITTLSRIGWFFVIARNSTFTYRGRAVDVRQIARELGVRYILEGSVRKAGNRIRITGQLVEGETGKHLWAEKYDRNLEDVFEVQDEITANIAGALEPQLAAAENIRAQRKTEQNLDAWDLLVQAMAKIAEFSKAGSGEALDFLDRAIAVDPSYGRAYGQKALALTWRVLQGWEDADTVLPASIKAVEDAIRYDPDEPWAYIAWFFIALIKHDGKLMLSSASKAIELNPNFALAHSFLGAAHALNGMGAEAFQWIERARQLSPKDVFRIEFDVHTGFAHFQLAEYEKAAEFVEAALAPKPDHLYPRLLLAATYAHLDRMDSAATEISKVLRLEPHYSLAYADENCVYVTVDEKARFLDGLRKAGLPE
jgi:adenylate cyclase